jgi:hypothetical protein
MNTSGAILAGSGLIARSPSRLAVRDRAGCGKDLQPTVMSGQVYPKNSTNIDFFHHIRACLFASVHGVSVVDLGSVPVSAGQPLMRTFRPSLPISLLGSMCASLARREWVSSPHRRERCGDLTAAARTSMPWTTLTETSHRLNSRTAGRPHRKTSTGLCCCRIADLVDRYERLTWRTRNQHRPRIRPLGC